MNNSAPKCIAKAEAIVLDLRPISRDVRQESELNSTQAFYPPKAERPAVIDRVSTVSPERLSPDHPEHPRF